MRILTFVIILMLLPLVVPSLAQPSPLPPVNGEPAAKETGYFNVMADPEDSPGVGEEETKDVRYLSLLVAHGLIHGIDWRRVGTEKKITIDERMFTIVRDISLEEIIPYDGSFRYSYTYQYVTTEVNMNKVGKSIQAKGESKAENMTEAWVEARELAFIDAVEEALKRSYTDKQLAIPNEVMGMITTYEIIYDDFNYLDRVYRFEIKTWVSFEARQSPFGVGTGSSSGTQ